MRALRVDRTKHACRRAQEIDQACGVGPRIANMPKQFVDEVELSASALVSVDIPLVQHARELLAHDVRQSRRPAPLVELCQLDIAGVLGVE